MTPRTKAAVRRVAKWLDENQGMSEQPMYPHVIGGTLITRRDLRALLALAARAETLQCALARAPHHWKCASLGDGRACDCYKAALSPRPAGKTMAPERWVRAAAQGEEALAKLADVTAPRLSKSDTKALMRALNVAPRPADKTRAECPGSGCIASPVDRQDGDALCCCGKVVKVSKGGRLVSHVAKHRGFTPEQERIIRECEMGDEWPARHDPLVAATCAGKRRKVAT